jgi:hypothetical protein
MDRRAFLKNAAGAAAIAVVGGPTSPVVSQRASARALRFVPQAVRDRTPAAQNITSLFLGPRTLSAGRTT